jgi:hypothetical protein
LGILGWEAAVGRRDGASISEFTHKRNIQTHDGVLAGVGRRLSVAALTALVATVLYAPAAQSQSRLREYEITSQLGLKFYTPEAFSCLSPAAYAAQNETRDEIGRVQVALDNIILSRGFFMTSHRTDLTPREEADATILRALVSRLDKILGGLLALPPCETDRIAYPVLNASGVVLGIYIIKTTQRVVTSERFIPTDQLTNVFKDRRDPPGVGVNVAWMFRPSGSNIVVAPFLSFDYLNMSVNHTFPGGSFLGTTSNVAGTAGVKVGPQFSNIWLYGIAGASALNETLRVNFIPVASSRTQTVAGATLGAGGSIQPAFLQGFGRPVSVFLEYQHTWWQDGQFSAPAASPAFKYNFKRDDDTFKFGFNVALGAPPVAEPPTTTFPVKAPRR